MPLSVFAGLAPVKDCSVGRRCVSGIFVYIIVAATGE